MSNKNSGDGILAIGMLTLAAGTGMLLWSLHSPKNAAQSRSTPAVEQVQVQERPSEEEREREYVKTEAIRLSQKFRDLAPKMAEISRLARQGDLSAFALFRNTQAEYQSLRAEWLNLRPIVAKYDASAVSETDKVIETADLGFDWMDSLATQAGY